MKLTLLVVFVAFSGHQRFLKSTMLYYLKQIFNNEGPRPRRRSLALRRIDVTLQILDKHNIQILERTRTSDFIVVDAEG